MKARWIAIVGRKGGSGKTALALGLAAHYARAGTAVTLVDLDPQGSASVALGADATGAELASALTMSPDAFLAFEGKYINEKILLISGGPELERLVNTKPLRQALQGDEAQVVLLDCPPGHADLDRLALQAADVVLACCEPHRLGIAGAARVLDEANARRPRPRCALVLGRMDERRGLDRAAPDLLAGAFAVPVLTVRQDSHLAAALNAGSLPPGHGRAAEDLEAVAAWIDKGDE